MTKSQVVVVTGASAGVGRAVVREFARQGASIGLIARGRERLDATKAEVEQLGGKALAISADVADAEALDQAADRVERELGPIDVWVNDAMTTVFAPFDQIAHDEFKRATEVSYLGFVYGTMAALKRMKPRNKGSIVQVGSALAYRSIPLQSAYCGAKHAIVGFTDSLRSELIHDRSEIRLTVVHLPAMNTIFQPEVAARAIVWASAHHRREVYVGWPTVKAIVGQEVAAGYADHYLATHGYEGQETEQPISSGRPDNLFEPAEGNYSAHGSFDARARGFSVQSWLDLNRGKVLGGAALLAGVMALFRSPMFRSLKSATAAGRGARKRRNPPVQPPFGGYKLREFPGSRAPAAN
jgi:NAD(P)-dependent dehydrogenase (short-subunit alcohol dehydrogenase family)